jgi:type I restriction enzyme S subunit
VNYPKSWETVTIGESLDLINGRAFKPTEWSSKGRPIVRIQNLNNPAAHFNFYSGELPAKFALNTGDLLFAWSGTPGTSFGAHIWKGGKAWLNQHIFKVGFSAASFDKTFLRLAINQNLSQYINASHGGAGLAHITKGKFEASVLPLPPLTEQHRIVEKIEELFSELDKGIENLKQAQAQLAVYRQALLKHAFEGKLTADWRKTHAAQLESADQLLSQLLQERRKKWKGRRRYVEPEPPTIDEQGSLPEKWAWASPEQISSFENYSLAIGPFGSNLKVSDYMECGVPLVFVRHIRASQFGGEQTTYVTPAKAEELRAHGVSGGDILITKMGEPPGDAAIYPKSQPDAVITADCIKLRLAPLLANSRYFLHAISSGIVRQQIINISSGVAQQKVSLGRFRSIAIPLPPQSEQERIVNELDAQLSALDALETDIVANLEKAEALRQSILKKAFSGEMVPQDPADEPASTLLARIRAERAIAPTSTPPKRRGRKPTTKKPKAGL